MSTLSVVLIGFELFFFVFNSASLISDLTAEEPYIDLFQILGFIVIVIPLLIGSLIQYYAVFKKNVTAAATIAFGSFCLFFLAFALLLSSVIEIVYYNESILESLNLFGILLSFTLFFFLTGWLHIKWKKRIGAETLPDNAEQRRLSNKERLAIAVIIMIAIASVFALTPTIPPPSAHNVRPDQTPFDLPDDATNVSYARGFRCDAFEFDISETEFRRWVNQDIRSNRSSRPAIEIITISEAHNMRRCASFSSLIPGPKKITITNGLLYTWKSNDGVITIVAAYDRNTGRAYYYRGE